MEFPSSINTIINELNMLDNVDNQTVTDLIKHAKPNEKDLQNFSNFEHCPTESYGRQLIFKNQKFKILLMSWQPGDYTAIHNHGFTQWGGVYFFGEATHRQYSNEQIIKLKSSKVFNKGETAAVCGNLTHLMGNSGKTNFSTLHIYGSNNESQTIPTNAKVYSPEKQTIIETSGSAYLDMPKELILNEIHFNDIELFALMDYLQLIKPFYLRNKQYETIKNIALFEKKPERFYQNAH